MTILTITVSLTAPKLASFFRGRSLDSQARGLLSLTRNGQSRAIGEGIPMEIWVDPTRGAFHLEADPTYEEHDPKQVEFPLYDDVKVEFMNSGLGQAEAASSPQGQALGNRPAGPRIRFQPDGSIAETSPALVRLTGRDGVSLYLVQATNRLTYEIAGRH